MHDALDCSIGKSISTKAIGNSSREDITDAYKPKEKSKEERDTMRKVLKQSESMFARYYLNEKWRDIRFKLLPMEDLVIGQPFTVRFKLENTSSRFYTVVAAMFVRSTYYTGEVHRLVKEQRTELVMSPESGSSPKQPLDLACACALTCFSLPEIKSKNSRCW